MSKIKVNEIEKASGSGITVPTGTSFTITDGLASGSLPTVPVNKGGTNLTSFTAGDVLYATGSTTLAKLAKGTAGQALKMNSGATAPEWGAVGGDSTPAWFGYLSANQTSYSQNTWYDFPCDAEKVDTDGALSTSNSDNYAFTVPSGKAGKYVVYAYMQLFNGGGSNSNNDHARIKLQKKPSGGSYADYAQQRDFIEPDINSQGLQFFTMIDLAVGDKIRIQVFREQQSGTYDLAGDSTVASCWMGFKIA